MSVVCTPCQYTRIQRLILLAKARAFDESKVKRDEKGRFAEKNSPENIAAHPDPNHDTSWLKDDDSNIASGESESYDEEAEEKERIREKIMATMEKSQTFKDMMNLTDGALDENVDKMVKDLMEIDTGPFGRPQDRLSQLDGMVARSLGPVLNDLYEYGKENYSDQEVMERQISDLVDTYDAFFREMLNTLLDNATHLHRGTDQGELDNYLFDDAKLGMLGGGYSYISFSTSPVAAALFANKHDDGDGGYGVVMRIKKSGFKDDPRIMNYTQNTSQDAHTRDAAHSTGTIHEEEVSIEDEHHKIADLDMEFDFFNVDDDDQAGIMEKYSRIGKVNFVGDTEYGWNS